MAEQQQPRDDWIAVLFCVVLAFSGISLYLAVWLDTKLDE